MLRSGGALLVRLSRTSGAGVSPAWSAAASGDGRGRGLLLGGMGAALAGKSAAGRIGGPTSTEVARAAMATRRTTSTLWPPPAPPNPPRPLHALSTPSPRPLHVPTPFQPQPLLALASSSPQALSAFLPARLKSPHTLTPRVCPRPRARARQRAPTTARQAQAPDATGRGDQRYGRAIHTEKEG